VSIEGGGFKDLGDADSQQVRQGHEVSRAQAAADILEPVQMFQQQVAPQGQTGQKLGDRWPPRSIDPSPPALPIPLAQSSGRLLVAAHVLVSRSEVAMLTNASAADSEIDPMSPATRLGLALAGIFDWSTVTVVIDTARRQ
jgi:hypothetical protein